MHSVDVQNILQALSRNFTKRSNLANSSVQKDKSDIILCKFVTDGLLILRHLGHLKEVSDQILGRHTRFFLYLCELCLHLVLISGYHAYIEALSGHFMTYIETVAIRSSRDNCPRFLTLAAISGIQVSLPPQKMFVAELERVF